MPIATTPPEASFVGDGTSRVFPLGFYAEFKSQLRVCINSVEQTAGWAFAEGAVTFDVAPEALSNVVISRQTMPAQVEDFVRETSYESAGQVVLPALDVDLDRLWMVAQDQARKNSTFADALEDHEQRFGTVETAALNAAASAASASAAAAAAAADQATSTAAAAAASSASATAATAAATASGHADAANASASTAAAFATTAGSSASAASSSASAAGDAASSVATTKSQIDALMPSIQSASGGQRPFATLADLNAYSGSDKANFVAAVLNDGTTANNGWYRWNGSAWVKSSYDPVTSAAADASNNSIAIGGVSSRVFRLEQETAEYTGTADLVPLITDTGNKVIFGVYQSSGAMYVSGALTESIVPEMLGRQSEMQFIGTGNVVPFVTDINNKVVLGFDRSAGKLIGAGLDSAVQALATPQPLPTAIVPKAINHLLFYGQSLSVGAVAGSVLSTTQPYSNVTFNGGPRAWSGSAWDFGTFKPLVEDAVSPAPDGGTNRAETVCSGAANYASTTMAQRGVNPASHVILCSTAGHGGYRIDQLYKTSAWYSNLLAHVSGARAQTTDHAVHAVGWIQGENDVTAPTSYATYRSRLEQLQVDMETDIRAITTQTHPVYLLSYQCSWGTKTFKDIALAQLDLCQKNSKFFLTTPTYHLPYAGDNIHLTAVGYKWMGAYFGRAYAALVRGERPQWLNPVSATLRGAELRVRFDVPQLPLVLDDVTLAATTNYGFAVLDGGAAATVSAIKTDGRDVVITLASVPTGAVTVRYALDYLGAGLAIGNGASGNLRDSTTDTISISSVSRPLYHVAPAFELAAIKLGE